MPISSLALSRTNKNFTDHLKGFELGEITETNPSNGVYRYTFADGTSPYTWAEVANAQGGVDSGQFKFGMNIGHRQMHNNTNSGGGFEFINVDPNNLHVFFNEPKSDSIALVNNVQTLLPTGRYTETSGTFASFLGGTAATMGYNYAYAWYPNSDRMSGSNSTPSMSRTDRYVEINWNTVALNETTYTTAQRNFGRTVAGKVKLVFQPFIVFDNLLGGFSDQGVYYGKPRYYDTTIAGTNLVTLKSSPPSAISTFTYPGGRVIGWTETDANFANPYVYLYKWNGSAYVEVRQGYISDGSAGWDNSPYTKTANFNTYTVPSGDGAGYYYIYVYQYDGYYNTFSAGAGSNYITV